MKKLVKQLIDLQKIDSQFDALQLQKGDLPFMIEEAQNELAAKTTKREDYEKSIEKGEADRRMFQMEIDAGKDKLKQYEDQLYKVQTNKEYDAISLEIDTKKMEIKELENKILQSMEEEEELKAKIEQLSDESGKIENQLKEYQNELQEIVQQTQAEEKRLSKQREAIVSEIEKRYQVQYERIRKAKDGLAVVTVKKNSCGGCYSAVPPQKIVEIREMHRLFTCEYCGRILVWVDDNN